MTLAPISRKPDGACLAAFQNTGPVVFAAVWALWEPTGQQCKARAKGRSMD